MRLSKATRLGIGAILVTVLSVWTLAAIPLTLAWFSPSSVNTSGIGCSGSNCNIYEPDMVVTGNYVHLAYLQKGSAYLYYSRGLTSSDGRVAWESPRRIATGVDRGNDGFAIAADNTGTVHVAYSSSKQLYYIKNAKQGDFGNWTNPESAGSSSDRINKLAMALDADHAPYISWAQGVDTSHLSFAYRKSDGNWTSKDLGSASFLYRNPKMVVTGSGDSAILHIMAERKRRGTDADFSVAYARGTREGNITISDWSRSFNNNGSDEAPYITIDPVTNVLYAGFVDTVGSGYRWSFSSSTDFGQSWASLIRAGFSGSSFWGRYSPMVAYNDTVYFMLGVQEGAGGKVGIYDVRYQRSTNTLSSPAAILNYANSNYKVAREIAYGITTNAKVGVWIRNFIEAPDYNSEPGGVEQTVRPNAILTINGGVASTKDPNLAITLTNIVGTRENLQMRVSVDTPVTDATPLQAFAETFTLPVSNLSQCSHTVYVQIVDTVKGLSSDVLSASTTVDNQVQADVQIRNPYLRSNAVVFSDLQQSSGPLVTDGDSDYTRVANFYIEVNGAAECSQLTSVSVGRSAASQLPPYLINAKFFANILPIPGQLAVGSNTIMLNVLDSVGNTQTYSREIKYDPTPPTLVTSGTLEINVPTSGPNILAGLAVAGDTVTDNMYPGRGFWGLVVANSRTAVADPVNDTTLVWQTVKVSGTTSNVTLPNWSLLGGLSAAQQTPGDYYVYVRFIDGAGNATNGYLTNKVTLSTIVKPTTSLPFVVHP